jgi:hypothetical protein
LRAKARSPDIDARGPFHCFENQQDASSFMDISGERDGIIVTCEGARVPTLLPAGATVWAWPQNDEAGVKWFDAICAAGKLTVKWSKVPAPHKDFAAWTEAGATADEVLAAMTTAYTWAKPAVGDGLKDENSVAWPTDLFSRG